MTTNRSWSHIKLKDVAKIIHGWPFKSRYFSETLTGKPIVVNIGNFQYSGGFRFDSTKLKEYRGHYPREYELSPGDILLVMTCQTSGGEILGIPGRIPNDGRIYLHNQRLGKVKITDPDRVTGDFLYWLFLCPDFKQELFVTASGTKILHTAPTKIENYAFNLPPIHEQRAIASVLGSLDDKIELNRRMNVTLEAMAQAIFRSWFVDFDPVRAKMEGGEPAGMDAETAALFPDGFEMVDGREVPEEWEVKSLDEIAIYLNGLALQKYPPEGEEYLPVIKIAQLRKGNVEGTDKASVNIDPAYIIDDGDIVFSWSGSLAVVLWCGGRGALNQHIFRVTSDDYPKWFYYLWTVHHLPEFQAIASGKATTMGHIQRHHLSTAKVLVPPSKQLDVMNRTLAPLIEMIVTNNVQSRTLATLRDALLPKLISGEIRVLVNDAR